MTCILIGDLSNMQPDFDLALAVAGGVPMEPYTSELAVTAGCRPDTSSVIVNTSWLIVKAQGVLNISVMKDNDDDQHG